MRQAVYFGVLVLFTALSLWRIVRMGRSYAFSPGGLVTILTLLFTDTDLFTLFSDEPNLWPTTATLDPYELRLIPLVLVTVGMVAFWAGESLVLRMFWRRPFMRTVDDAEQDVASAGLGWTIVVLAIIAQLITFARLGVQSVESFLTDNATYGWQIGSDGYVLLQMAFALLPVGAGLAMPRRALDGRLANAIAIFFLMSTGFFFTASKAGAMVPVMYYGITLFWRLGRLPRWARSPILIGALASVAVVSIALKTQYKYDGGIHDTSTDGMAASLRVATGRFEGGDFQTFCTIYHEVSRLHQFRDGAFNAAAITNLVPRQLWPDKPISPVGTLFWYLVHVDNPSGAALMTVGSFFIDWGWLGIPLGMIGAGAFFALLDMSLLAAPYWSLRGAFGLTGTLTAMPLVEGGFVSAMPTLVGLSVVWMVAATVLTLLDLFPRREGERAARRASRGGARAAGIERTSS